MTSKIFTEEGYTNATQYFEDNKIKTILICVVAAAALALLGSYLISEGSEHMVVESVDSGYYIKPSDGTFHTFSNLQVFTGDMHSAGIQLILGSVAIGGAVALLIAPIILIEPSEEAPIIIAISVGIFFLLGIIWAPMGTTDYFEEIAKPRIFGMNGQPLGWSAEWGDNIMNLDVINFACVGYCFLTFSTLPLLVPLVKSIAGPILYERARQHAIDDAKMDAEKKSAIRFALLSSLWNKTSDL